MKNYTLCTVCVREVGAVRNWSRGQAGQPAEWRVTRHRAGAQRLSKSQREPICNGSGIQVHPSAVMTMEVSA